ncbi:MAG: hypothetical protein IRY90_05860 [Actinomadura rubrobrunea]|nr:hypothetical protein [Actinomadura rubrobrunea]
MSRPSAQVTGAGTTALLFATVGCGLGPGRPVVPDEFAAVDARAAQLVRKVQIEGGFTVNPRDGTEPTVGYVVNTGDGARLEDARTFFGGSGFASGRAALDRFVRDNSAALQADRGLYLGAWYDRAKGRVVLSTVQVVDDRDQALRLGAARHQRAVFDLASGREVPTGESGPG